MPGFHDGTNGSARGRNTIVKWTQSGLRFAHFGDYGQSALTAAQLEELRDLDVIMVPAGGFFTIEPAQTAALIEQLRPRVAILMHFRTAGRAGAARGASGGGGAVSGAALQTASLTVTRATLPAATEVWVMEPAADSVVVNAAGGIAGAPVAQGSLATVWGNFAGSATASYTSFPLPRKLGETEVVIGTESAPLLVCFTGAGQFSGSVAAHAGADVIEVRVEGSARGRGDDYYVERRARIVSGGG